MHGSTSCGGAAGSRRPRLTYRCAEGRCRTDVTSCWRSRSTEDDQSRGTRRSGPRNPLQEPHQDAGHPPVGHLMPPLPTPPDLWTYLRQQVRTSGCSAACSSLQACSSITSVSRATALAPTTASLDTHSDSSCTHTHTQSYPAESPPLQTNSPPHPGGRPEEQLCQGTVARALFQAPPPQGSIRLLSSNLRKSGGDSR